MVGSTLTIYSGSTTDGYYITVNGEKVDGGTTANGISRAELEYTVTEEDAASGLSIEASKG